ncbi:hypothetical protein KIL84_015686 [Mauremys mutica]|uniref:Uncharacterized protein n=1 Tax=Mauremys mutica TaxID=74926 RepID=A0A9D4AQ40_9SAUR|nr:hypothetical protein KIL84_015686 [Mauremys mutica]
MGLPVIEAESAALSISGIPSTCPNTHELIFRRLHLATLALFCTPVSPAALYSSGRANRTPHRACISDRIVNSGHLRDPIVVKFCPQLHSYTPTGGKGLPLCTWQQHANLDCKFFAQMHKLLMARKQDGNGVVAGPQFALNKW